MSYLGTAHTCGRAKSAEYGISILPLDNFDLKQSIKYPQIMIKTNCTCHMNAILSFDLFMVYIPKCKQQLRTMK